MIFGDENPRVVSRCVQAVAVRSSVLFGTSEIRKNFANDINSTHYWALRSAVIAIPWKIGLVAFGVTYFAVYRRNLRINPYNPDRVAFVDSRGPMHCFCP
jgi:hypothetical protein